MRQISASGLSSISVALFFKTPHINPARLAARILFPVKSLRKSQNLIQLPFSCQCQESELWHVTFKSKHKKAIWGNYVSRKSFNLSRNFLNHNWSVIKGPYKRLKFLKKMQNSSNTKSECNQRNKSSALQIFGRLKASLDWKQIGHRKIILWLKLKRCIVISDSVFVKVTQNNYKYWDGNA